jgi:hypothetical protein
MVLGWTLPAAIGHSEILWLSIRIGFREAAPDIIEIT